MFIMAGGMKIIGVKQQVEIFEELQLPQWFRVFTGLVEFIGAVLLIIGFFNIEFVAIGGIILAFTMLGATITHILIKDPFRKAVVPIIITLMAVILTYTQIDSLINIFI